MGNICKTTRQDIVIDALSPNFPSRTNDTTTFSGSIKDAQARVIQQRVRHKMIVRSLSSSNDNEGIRTPLSYGMSAHEKTMVKITMSKHPLLGQFDAETLDSVIDQMKLLNLDPDTLVFEQGSAASHFYVVSVGKLEKLVNSHKDSELGKGDYFGDQALRHPGIMNATVRTLDRSFVWALDKETFRSIVFAAVSKEHEENLKLLDSVKLFNCLSSRQKTLLVDAITVQRFEPGLEIVTEGAPGDLFFIIREGEVICSKAGAEIRRMRRGEFFGEQALIYDTIRTATVTALTHVKCASIGREMLTNVLGAQLETVIYRNSLKIALEASDYLGRLNTEQIEMLVSTADLKPISQGKVIATTGICPGRNLYVLLKGKVRGPLPLNKFEILGESEILDDIIRGPTGEYVAETDCVVAELSKDAIDTSIGGEYKTTIDHNKALVALCSTTFLSCLSTVQKQSLLAAVTLTSFADNAFVFRAGDPSDNFYIIKEGSAVKEVRSQPVRYLSQHSVFGLQELLNQMPRSADVKATTELICWIIHRDMLLDLIDADTLNKLNLQLKCIDHTVTFEDLLPVRQLGRTTFGTVLQVSHKNCMYVLKGFSRSKVDKHELYLPLNIERQVLLQFDHPFIVKLARTFKDKDRVYFMMEYVSGIDLLDLIYKTPNSSEATAKFYVACLVCALSYIHKQGVIYRNLRPENVIVDSEGYLKLIDFGASKRGTDKTFTMVGTPHYMAPEMITYQGYGRGVDYWALGILLFEMLNGYVPFGEDKEDPYDIYETVLHGKVPGTQVLKKFKIAGDVVNKLLNKNPAIRVSAAESLQNHNWYKLFNWVSST